MSQEEQNDLLSHLSEGRRQLAHAAEVYGRPLGPEEYWWLGVGLAAITLAELGEKPYIVGRLEQLVDRLGYKGVKGDWLQRFVEELANLDAEGLLWPVYQRSEAGPVAETGVTVYPGFDATAGYFLALAHIAVALAVYREQPDQVGELAAIVAEIVESGLAAGHEERILAALQPEAGDEA